MTFAYYAGPEAVKGLQKFHDKGEEHIGFYDVQKSHNYLRCELNFKLHIMMQFSMHINHAAHVFRVLEGSRRSIKFDIEADTSFPIALMIIGVRKPVLIWRPEGEKIEKHPHEGCVFHALNVYDRVEIPKNARGLIYFVLMEVDNNLTITCTSEESHQDRETSSSLARALTMIEKKLDKLIKLHNHDQ